MAQENPQRSSDVAALVALYMLAEQQLIDGFTAVLRRMLPTLAGRQAALPKLRRVARVVLTRLERDTTPLVERALAGAANGGERQALAEIRTQIEGAPEAVTKAIVPRQPPGGLVRPPTPASDAVARMGRDLAVPGGPQGPRGPGRELPSGGEPFDFSMSHGERSARAIIDDLSSSLEDVRFRITRLPDDIYKLLAPRAAVAQVLGVGITPEQAQAIAWRDFVSNGVTGFTDRAGRNWSLSAYVEMAVRTASQRAYNASHLATMHASGIHLFLVPTHGASCPLCFPWQNAVLTDGPMENPPVPVDGTIQEAVAAGLNHPNCAHTFVAFIPGITERKPRLEWTDAHQQAYQLTQKQRRLELEVRKAKRRLETALTPQAQRDAAADVRAAQAKVRALVNANPDTLSRQSRREQVDLRNATTKLPPELS